MSAPLAREFSNPGPHGWPARWSVNRPSFFTQTCLKICVDLDHKDKIHYLSFHPNYVSMDLHSGPSKKRAKKTAKKAKKKGLPNPEVIGMARGEIEITLPGNPDMVKLAHLPFEHIEWQPRCAFSVNTSYGMENFEWRKINTLEGFAVSDPKIHYAGQYKAEIKEGWLAKGYDYHLVCLNTNRRGDPNTLGFTDKGVNDQDMNIGLEIVATWTTRTQKFVGCRFFTFQFWNGGLRGDFGEAFTRVAILSACGLWDKEYNDKIARDRQAENKRRMREEMRH
jgi:hypothetical protein